MVIAASIVFFKTPASITNIVGTSVALGGVFAYSLIKRTVKEKQDFESVRAPVLSCALLAARACKYEPAMLHLQCTYMQVCCSAPRIYLQCWAYIHQCCLVDLRDACALLIMGPPHARLHVLFGAADCDVHGKMAWHLRDMTSAHLRMLAALSACTRLCIGAPAHGAAAVAALAAPAACFPVAAPAACARSRLSPALALQAIESTWLEDALAIVSPGSVYTRFFGPKTPASADKEEGSSDLEYYL